MGAIAEKICIRWLARGSHRVDDWMFGQISFFCRSQAERTLFASIPVFFEQAERVEWCDAAELVQAVIDGLSEGLIPRADFKPANAAGQRYCADSGWWRDDIIGHSVVSQIVALGDDVPGM